MKKTLALLLVLLMMFSSLSFADTASTVAGKELKAFGIIKGDQNGNLNEMAELTREESITILNRMMGAAAEADKMANASPFSDVPADHWAAKQIAYAKKEGWTNGVGDNKFGIKQTVTTQQFLTLMLRALGNTSANVYSNAMTLADDYHLLKNANTVAPQEQIKRADVFIIMYNTLEAKLVNSDVTLGEKLGLMTSASTSGSSDASTADPTVYPLTLTDGEGRQVTIDSEPQRIISVAPSVTEILFSIGAGNKLVGRTDYCDYPAEVADIQSIGTLREPSIEKIAELNPDLIIVSTHFTEEAAKQLENLGLKVFVLKAQENFDGLYKTVSQAAQITNHQAEGAKVIADVKARVASVLAKVKDLKPVTCYYSVSTGETEYTATGDTFIHELLTMAGGDNVAKDGQYWAYSAEKLLEHNPEIILVGKQFDALNTFINLEAHKDLDAVKNGKVIEIDGARIGRLSPRIVESLEEVAKVLHPEIAFDNQSVFVLLPFSIAK